MQRQPQLIPLGRTRSTHAPSFARISRKAGISTRRVATTSRTKSDGSDPPGETLRRHSSQLKDQFKLSFTPQTGMASLELIQKTGESVRASGACQACVKKFAGVSGCLVPVGLVFTWQASACAGAAAFTSGWGWELGDAHETARSRVRPPHSALLQRRLKSGLEGFEMRGAESAAETL